MSNNSSHSASANTVRRLCPRCGSDSSAQKALPYGSTEWPLKACAKCEFIYLEIVPAYAALAGELGWDKTFAAWHTERAKDRYHVLRSRLGRTVRDQLRTVFKRTTMESLLLEFAAPGNVLDVGCGKGTQLENLPETYVPFGIEVSPEQAAHAKAAVAPRGGQIVVAPGAEALATFPPEFFSCIIMRSYLEHESEPVRALNGAYHALASGGVLLLKVPNYGSLNRRLFGTGWCGFRFPDHVNYFTPGSLRAMVEEAGFSIRRFSMRDRWPTSDNMWMIAARG
ncbi:MAG: class I SAM-dependent methyltransferase [Gammaproteobacteria bacterium]|nr:class I SAM-dependent methyltransferase [Gammaproteobacteria bacterium]